MGPTRPSIGSALLAPPRRLDVRQAVVLPLAPDPGTGTCFAELAGISSTEVERLMPERHQEWVYFANADPEWEGFEGFMASREEIDRIAGALSEAAD